MGWNDFEMGGGGGRVDTPLRAMFSQEQGSLKIALC